MIQRLNAPVTVYLVFDHKRRKTEPKAVLWEGSLHEIVTVGLHHAYRQGRTLYHVFSVASKTLFFRLVLNTDNLQWTLEEIADGEAN